ncbi:hypothetical protein JFY59_02005 [Porphyromonas gingivalis]|nr:hypothetical protein [Porphyromonas gingivalis]MCE8188974.1 hypothetical protein [Porphyromonas gingivalis]
MNLKGVWDGIVGEACYIKGEKDFPTPRYALCPEWITSIMSNPNMQQG